MKVKLIRRGIASTSEFEEEINGFLREHPEYKLVSMVYDGTGPLAVLTKEENDG